MCAIANSTAELRRVQRVPPTLWTTWPMQFIWPPPVWIPSTANMAHLAITATPPQPPQTPQAANANGGWPCQVRSGLSAHLVGDVVMLPTFINEVWFSVHERDPQANMLPPKLANARDPSNLQHWNVRSRMGVHRVMP